MGDKTHLAAGQRLDDPPPEQKHGAGDEPEKQDRKQNESRHITDQPIGQHKVQRDKRRRECEKANSQRQLKTVFTPAVFLETLNGQGFEERRNLAPREAFSIRNAKAPADIAPVGYGMNLAPTP